MLYYLGSHRWLWGRGGGSLSARTRCPGVSLRSSIPHELRARPSRASDGGASVGLRRAIDAGRQPGACRRGPRRHARRFPPCRVASFSLGRCDCARPYRASGGWACRGHERRARGLLAAGKRACCASVGLQARAPAIVRCRWCLRDKAISTGLTAIKDALKAAAGSGKPPSCPSTPVIKLLSSSLHRALSKASPGANASASASASASDASASTIWSRTVVRGATPV